METVTLTINDTTVKVPHGKTILEAATANGIYIPHLCWHQDLKPAGVCRVCMVEIEGQGMVTACNTPVRKGMKVKTDSPEANRARQIALELLIVNHHGECLTCAKNLDCILQKVAQFSGVDEQRIGQLRKPTRVLPLDTSNPFFDYDPNKCILCGICIRTCEQITGINAIDFISRGYNTKVGTFGNSDWLESRCSSCGECVVRCPVGALSPKTFQKPHREVKTTCTYCGVGCGILLGVRDNRIVQATGDSGNTVNKGALCVKGRFGYEFINHPDRLTEPLIKKNGKFVKASWKEALDLVAGKFKKYKGNQFAAISSAKCSNEENYLVQKFTRAVMKTNTVDHCARLCHAPSVAGLVQSFGSGAMTNSISEIKDAQCIFAIGTNTTAAHPVIAMEMKKAVMKGAKMIVANPRKIELSECADVFLQHCPGSDVALLMGMMRVIVDEGLEDTSFIQGRCENFKVFKDSLKKYPLPKVEKITGVDRKEIVQAARIYATNSPAMLFYSMGITQHTHGTDNVLATSNIALLTGNVGKPSTGVNPLRGQSNVQGACDLGALPDVYPGYQKVNLPDIKKKMEKAWGTNLNDVPGLTHLEIFDAVDEGKIKALYLVGENPILSEANAHHVEAALQKIDFLVVQDIFLTETAKYADVVLPAASFAEKDGTITNTERRVQRLRKVINPPGKAKPDWWITCEIAKRMKPKGFDFKNPSQIMDEIGLVCPIYSGISYNRIETQGIQWPCRSREDNGTRFLHKEKFATPNGKGKLIPLIYKPSAELPDRKYPLILTTERSLFHFHTATMTRRVFGLNFIKGQELVEINPLDAVKYKIEDGGDIYVQSRRGEVTAKAFITERSPQGVISMTFHFAETRTNVLTNSAMDPVAKIPETKVCAVRIGPIKKS